uniref:Uncharacterized protein n=1 Tax=Oryza brachyantha TaxID=4533 RepID=J3MWZ4_ORYBR
MGSTVVRICSTAENQRSSDHHFLAHCTTSLSPLPSFFFLAFFYPSGAPFGRGCIPRM